MSIFKESFRKYVKQQIAIREHIVSRGNNGEGRFNPSAVDLSKHGGPSNLSIPEGSFFTQAQRTCVLRMSSGADLTEQGAISVAGDSKYYTENQLKGSGLARRYVLQGGTLTMDKKVLAFSDKSKITKQDPRVVNVPLLGPQIVEEGKTKTLYL